ncbi:MAG: TIGR04086 family membrane protein [Bacillota bacterium]
MPGKLQKEPVKGLDLLAVGRGTLAGALASFAGTILAACLFYFTEISESTFPYVVSFVLFLSAILAGCLASRYAGCKGLAHGAAAGTAIFLILWLAAVSVVPGPVTSAMLLKKFFLLAAGGAVGGFIGIALIP